MLLRICRMRWPLLSSSSYDSAPVRRFGHRRSVVAGFMDRQWLASGDRAIFANISCHCPIIATECSAKTKHTQLVLTVEYSQQRQVSYLGRDVSSHRWCVPKPLFVERPPHNYKTVPVLQNLGTTCRSWGMRSFRKRVYLIFFIAMESHVRRSRDKHTAVARLLVDQGIRT